MSEKFSQETIEKAASEIAVGLANGFAVLFGASTDAPPAANAGVLDGTTAAGGKKRKARRRKPKADAPAAAPEPEGPTIEQVRKKILDVIEDFGNDGAAEVLEDFGVKKISELDAEQYEAVIEAATKYLADDDGDGGGAAD